MRRLEAEFEDRIEVEHVLAPRTFGAGEALRWLEEAVAGVMPVDARLWLERPPRTSHSACYAVLAAAEQGRGGAMLRRLREGYAVERRAFETVEALLDAARDVAVDVAHFEAALRSSAVVEALAADLERGRGVDAPALAVAGGEPLADPAAWREAIIAAGVEPGARRPTVEAALVRGRRLATAEVAACCGLPYAQAAAALWRGATELRFEVLRVAGGGELWSSVRA